MKPLANPEIGSHLRAKWAGRLTNLLHGLGLAVLLWVGLSARPSIILAAQLTNRSLVLGISKIGATTNHSFSFHLNTASNVGSIKFEYCSNSPLKELPCDVPASLDVSGASLASQQGEVGFSIASTTSNSIILSRAVQLSVIGDDAYNFQNIVNPSSAGTTFVRISFYASADASGSSSDEGSLAFAVVDSFQTSAYVPPYLAFCSGVTVALDCTSATGFNIHLGNLASNATAAATSQFAGATNYTGGYATYITGTTMTAGNEIIPAMAAQSPAINGVGQFGVNIRQNSVPGVGADAEGAGSAAVTSNYAISNLYRFVSGDALTATNLPSDYNRFTVSYIVNTPSNQAPGIYSSTITYTAIASY